MTLPPGHRLAVFPSCGAGLLCMLLLATPIWAQDLDPRAYARAPVNATFLVTGFSVSHGGVVTDASLPLADVHATLREQGRHHPLRRRLQHVLDRVADGLGAEPEGASMRHGSSPHIHEHESVPVVRDTRSSQL